MGLISLRQCHIMHDIWPVRYKSDPKSHVSLDKMRCMIFQRNLFLRCWLFLSVAVHAQDSLPFRRGEVLERVFLRGQTEESFALYLPRAYDPEVPMPALFIFDPAARGKLGVETFEKAAESTGWILIGSNDSRNGPFERSFGQANRLFADALSRFKIDADHIYVTGFSGGARLATTLAVLSDHIRGVIACGAAFSPNPGQIPAPGASFSYVGIVGTRDMNYQEMRKARDWLAKINLSHRLFFFDGGHQWPPEPQILRAVNWMSFQTGVASPVSRPDIYGDYFEGERALADTLFSNGRYFESAGEYQMLIDQFGGNFPMDSVWERLSMIRGIPDYRKQARIDNDLGEKEASLRRRFSKRFREEVEDGSPPENFTWWQREKDKLDSKYLASGMEQEKNLGARIYNFLFAMPFESSNQWRRQNQYDKSRYCSHLLTVLFPENGYAQVRLAEEYALVKEPLKMIASLKKAKKLGYSDTSSIRDNPLFAPYLHREDFPFYSRDGQQ